MQYLAITTTVADMQAKLDSIENEFKVRQIFPLVNDPKFLIFAERRTPAKPTPPRRPIVRGHFNDEVLR